VKHVEHWRRPPSKHPVESAGNLKPGMMIEIADHRVDGQTFMLVGPTDPKQCLDDWHYPQLTTAWAYTIAQSPAWDDPDEWEEHMTHGGPAYPSPWLVRLHDGWAHWWVADADHWSQL